jgi:hypothetical protein
VLDSQHDAKSVAAAVGLFVLWRKVEQQRPGGANKRAAKHKSRCAELHDVTKISFGRQNWLPQLLNEGLRSYECMMHYAITLSDFTTHCLIDHYLNIPLCCFNFQLLQKLA